MTEDGHERTWEEELVEFTGFFLEGLADKFPDDPESSALAGDLVMSTVMSFIAELAGELPAAKAFGGGLARYRRVRELKVLQRGGKVPVLTPEELAMEQTGGFIRLLARSLTPKEKNAQLAAAATILIKSFNSYVDERDREIILKVANDAWWPE